ncbi:MAG: branched-chain amino acid ABC transporter permease [Xanthobacteraceae bacterium]|nr:branched-chain amino acid ABC transporter permease [Xanthobacteraceae bacterium]
MYFVTLILIWSIFAVAFDLVFGLAGMLSFGHAAFFGAGAFVYGLVMQALPDQFVLAVLGAVAAASFLALVAGVLALRLSGIYFSLTTLAIAELVFFAASSPLRAVTGGEDGIAGVPRPVLLGLDFNDDRSFYFLVLGIFLAVLAMVATLRQSPFGKVLNGIRLCEIRAEQVGFNVKICKAVIFAVSGAFSGLAGALLAGLIMYVNPQTLHWSTSGDVVIMTLLGGKGTLFGPILGVAAYEVLKETVSAYTVHWYGILGLIFILATIYLPSGIFGAFARPLQRLRGRKE